MPIVQLGEKIWFPSVSESEQDGLLAFGGSLSSQRLLLAYQSGIFPWYSSDQPIMWWSPDPRFVLLPAELKVSRTMRQLLNQNLFEVTLNQCFGDVIAACGKIIRKEQQGTWITTEMQDAYIHLHKLGHAHSIEVWREKELVGGLYGVRIGDVFCGESMFSTVSNSSKYGFISMIEKKMLGEIKLIDCQVYTAHLESLGAKMINRNSFLNYLKNQY